MIRLHMVVEGQTEEEFVNSLLVNHLGAYDISTDVRRVETSRRSARFRRSGTIDAKIFRGGLGGYEKAKGDLLRWMKEDQNSDAYFTTMFDLYALPEEFPGFAEAKRLAPYDRVNALEDAFAADLTHRKFIPYIQLHEFEALILSEPSKFTSRFIEHSRGIQNLVEACESFPSPELINDDPNKAPSKRIIREIPDYKGTKASAGPLIAQNIGLQTIRQKCPHFNEWLGKLENIENTA